MSDNMNLVEHVRRNKNGLTKMQIQIPISMRAGMAALSARLGISQLAVVRSALAAYLLQHEPTWQGSTAPAPEPAPAPAPEPAPAPAPEPAPALVPVTKKATVPTPVAKKPPAAGAAPTTKKPRAKKEKAI